MQTRSHPGKKWQLTAAVILFLIATLACGFGPSTDEAPADDEVPTVAPTAAVEGAEAETEAEPTREIEEPPPSFEIPDEVPESSEVDQTESFQPPARLSGEQREQLASATVFIAMLQDNGGERFIVGSGSGTIISDDGLILTNAHVANPSAVGLPISEEPDALGIGLVESADQPPVPTYLAEVVAVDGLLDLAVLRITSNLDGSRVNAADLALPFVPLGDSDTVRLGDNVNIFGFPGIGGDTITFTRGSVSGFSSQEPVGNRAWIKTDATIAGGNSGGLATNDRGQIIGIPTRASAGENELITDCRVVQDTNGDGRLNEADNCVPIGGFINALRPIELAMPLIRAAQANVAYESPYIVDLAEAELDEVRFPFVTWAADFDDDGCPLDPLDGYTAEATQLVAVFGYRGLIPGEDVTVYWLHNGEVIEQDTFAWDGGTTGECLALWFRADEVFAEGEYSVLIYTGPDDALVGEATTTVGAGQVVLGGVTVTGQIIDADTGRGIPDAGLIVLNPGVNVEVWLENPREEEIYTFAEANRRGSYTLPRPLMRGERYEGVAFADGYDETIGYLEFDEQDSDPTVIDLELTR